MSEPTQTKLTKAAGAAKTYGARALAKADVKHRFVVDMASLKSPASGRDR